MVNYREILRLSSDPKNSQRSIELMLHSSHHTIRKVQDAAKAAGISWPLEDDVTNEMLKEALFPEEGAATALYTQPDYPQGVSTSGCKFDTVVDRILQTMRK